MRGSSSRLRCRFSSAPFIAGLLVLKQRNVGLRVRRGDLINPGASSAGNVSRERRAAESVAVLRLNGESVRRHVLDALSTRDGASRRVERHGRASRLGRVDTHSHTLGGRRTGNPLQAEVTKLRVENGLLAARDQERDARLARIENRLNSNAAKTERASLERE